MIILVIIIRIVIMIYNNVNENHNFLDFNLVAVILNLSPIRYSHLYSVINVSKMLS